MQPNYNYVGLVPKVDALYSKRGPAVCNQEYWRPWSVSFEWFWLSFKINIWWIWSSGEGTKANGKGELTGSCSTRLGPQSHSSRWRQEKGFWELTCVLSLLWSGCSSEAAVPLHRVVSSLFLLCSIPPVWPQQVSCQCLPCSTRTVRTIPGSRGKAAVFVSWSLLALLRPERKHQQVPSLKTGIHSFSCLWWKSGKEEHVFFFRGVCATGWLSKTSWPTLVLSGEERSLTQSFWAPPVNWKQPWSGAAGFVGWAAPVLGVKAFLTWLILFQSHRCVWLYVKEGVFWTLVPKGILIKKWMLDKPKTLACHNCLTDVCKCVIWQLSAACRFYPNCSWDHSWKEKVLDVFPSFWEITMGQEATVGTVSRRKPGPKETGLFGQYGLELSMKEGFLV